MSDMIKSTRDFGEHIRNVLRVQELKAVGTSDSKVCKELGIGYSTLQKYKALLAEISIEALSDEYIKEKKVELDDQVQVVIAKFYDIITELETHHTKMSVELEDVLLGMDLTDQKQKERAFKIRKQNSYPFQDVSAVANMLLGAIKLRKDIWIDDSHPPPLSPKSKKITLNLNNFTGITEGIDKLEKIADSIVAGE